MQKKKKKRKVFLVYRAEKSSQVTYNKCEEKTGIFTLGMKNRVLEP